MGVQQGMLYACALGSRPQCSQLHTVSKLQTQKHCSSRWVNTWERLLGLLHQQQVNHDCDGACSDMYAGFMLSACLSHSMPAAQVCFCALNRMSVVVPAQAIRSDNPIIFFEHVLLYNIKGETHDGDYCQSLERAEVRR
jgi:hypothetical protein